MYLIASEVAVSTWGAITSARPLPLPLPEVSLARKDSQQCPGGGVYSSVLVSYYCYCCVSTCIISNVSTVLDDKQQQYKHQIMINLINAEFCPSQNKHRSVTHHHHRVVKATASSTSSSPTSHTSHLLLTLILSQRYTLRPKKELHPFYYCHYFSLLSTNFPGA